MKPLLRIFGAFAFLAAQHVSPALAADYVIKVSHAVPPNAPLHRALLQFKEQVEKESAGRLEIRVFHSGQLGGQRESVEAAQTGAVEIVATPNGILASFVPDFQLIDIPFQFETLDKARTFLDVTGQKMLFPALASANLVGLAVWEQGYRNIGSVKKPVTDLADMSKLNIRTMEAPLHIAAWKALGANPTPLGWGQVYTAMQQGLLDAVENPSYIFTQSKIHETIHYFTVSHHIYDPILMVGSKKYFDTLPADLRTIVFERMRGLTATDRAMAEADVVQAEKEMESGGIKIRRLSAEERKILASASQPAVIKELEASLGSEKVAQWQEAVAASVSQR